jgi:hypothetical protein
MPPRRRRLAFGMPREEHALLTLDDWRAIMQVSGINLRAPELTRVFLSTLFLTTCMPIEQSAPSKALLNKIQKLAKLVSSLRVNFPTDDNQDSDLISCELDRIRKYVTQSREQLTLLGHQFLLVLFSYQLKVTESLVTAILRASKDPKAPEFVEGTTWDTWINVLTLILKNAGHPVEARNDYSDLEMPSPFVIFVRELQNRLPRHLYKKRSEVALATAINRARKGWPLPNLNASSTDFLLNILLGAFKPLATDTGLAWEVVQDKFKEVSDLLKNVDAIGRVRSGDDSKTTIKRSKG